MNVENRLSRLERKSRRNGAAVLALLVALAAVIGYGADGGVTDSVRARKVVIVNEEGTAVVEIGAAKTGGFLLIRSKEGAERVQLAATLSGSALDLKSITGRNVISVQAGFVAGMMHADSGMITVDSVNSGATVIMGNRVTETPP